MDDVLHCINFWPDIPLNRKNTEQQIFTKYFNAIERHRVTEFIDDIPEIVKSASSSQRFRNVGNELYNEKKYVAAMRVYTKSIVRAPLDSVEFGLAVANRSATLFYTQRYKECLVDIEIVFRSEYPKNMLYKIFLRQAKCFVVLKYHRQASEAIQLAKSHFETAKVTMARKDIDAIANNISAVEKSKNVGAADQSEDTEEQSSLPALTDGENPQFAYASNRVSMKQNKQRGRYVVAKVDIKEGDVLLMEEPYCMGACQISTEGFIYCSGCFTNTLTCIPCTFCTNVVFCSGECRKQYWDSTHRWLCAGQRRSFITGEFSLALAVLFRASHTGFQTAISDEQVFGNKLDNYPYVTLQMTHKKNIPPDVYTTYVKASIFLVIYLIHFTDYFDWLHGQAGRPAGTREELYRIIGSTLLTILSRNDTNAEVVKDKYVLLMDKLNIALADNRVSAALYVSSTLLNHSCLPNAVCSYHGKVKIVIALADIGKGTEVTVSYLKLADIVDVDSRRVALQNNYYFWCTCRACTEQSSLMPWLCPKCRGRAFSSSDERTAKCMECQHELSLKSYKMMEMEAMFLSRMVVKTKNISNLSKSAAMLKQIYHPTNCKLIVSYLSCATNNEVYGDFKNCLEYFELAANLQKVVYNNSINDMYVATLMAQSLALVNYCLVLKYQKPALYRKYLKLTKEAISSTTQLLKYHVHKESVVIYQRQMLRILNAGDPNFGAIPVLYHSNVVHSE